VFQEARPVGLAPSLYDGEPYPYYRTFAPEWYLHVLPLPAPHVGEAAADQDLRQLRTLALEIQRLDPRWAVEHVVLDDYTSFLHLSDGRGRICSAWAGAWPSLDLNEEGEGEEENYEVPTLHEAVRVLVRYGLGLSLSDFRSWRRDALEEEALLLEGEEGAGVSEGLGRVEDLREGDRGLDLEVDAAGAGAPDLGHDLRASQGAAGRVGVLGR